MAVVSAPTRLAIATLAMAVLGACGSSGSPTTSKSASAALAAACRPATAADQTVTTRTHVFLLHIGTPETMLMITAAQARAKHITSGELMIGGSMAGMPSGAMNRHTTTRHLELHICDRASGKVVSGATPTITLTPSPGGTPRQIPVAVMEGVVAGPADLHYGNNVPLRTGTSYTIAVRLGADHAAFKYAAPRAM